MPLNKDQKAWLDAIYGKKPKSEASQPQTSSPSASQKQMPQKKVPAEPVPLKPIPGLAQAATMDVDGVLARKQTHSVPASPSQSDPSPSKAKKSVRVQSPER